MGALCTYTNMFWHKIIGTCQIRSVLIVSGEGSSWWGFHMWAVSCLIFKANHCHLNFWCMTWSSSEMYGQNIKAETHSVSHRGGLNYGDYILFPLWMFLASGCVWWGNSTRIHGKRMKETKKTMEKGERWLKQLLHGSKKICMWENYRKS